MTEEEFKLILVLSFFSLCLLLLVGLTIAETMEKNKEKQNIKNVHGICPGEVYETNVPNPYKRKKLTILSVKGDWCEWDDSKSGYNQTGKILELKKKLEKEYIFPNE